jgi:hypothetical protein
VAVRRQFDIALDRAFLVAWRRASVDSRASASRSFHPNSLEVDIRLSALVSYPHERVRGPTPPPGAQPALARAWAGLCYLGLACLFEVSFLPAICRSEAQAALLPGSAQNDSGGPKC